VQYTSTCCAGSRCLRRSCSRCSTTPGTPAST
jgi:hypothetical protein